MAKQYIICGEYIANGQPKTAVLCLNVLCNFYSLDEAERNLYDIPVFNSPEAVESAVHDFARYVSHNAFTPGVDGVGRIYPVRLGSVNCPILPEKRVDADHFPLRGKVPGLSAFLTKYAVKQH